MFVHSASNAGQCKTTVMGMPPVGWRETGIRNRWPSLATAYGWKVPGSVRPVWKSRYGTVARPFVSIPTVEHDDDLYVWTHR